MVLSIGETVEEITDSGFLDTTQTIHACLLGKDLILQCYAKGIRYIYFIFLVSITIVYFFAQIDSKNRNT